MNGLSEWVRVRDNGNGAEEHRLASRDPHPQPIPQETSEIRFTLSISWYNQPWKQLQGVLPCAGAGWSGFYPAD